MPLYFACLLLFTHFARPFDVVLKGFKLPAIICSACIVVAFLGGGLKELRSRVGTAFLLMLGWMCVSIPLSHWMGGSFNYVLTYVQLFLPLMLLVAVASKTPGDIVKLYGVLAFSCLCHLVLNSRDEGGRAALSGTFGNPDDVALLAGFTIPFIILVGTRLKNPVLRWGLLGGGVGYLVLTIGRTATRAAIPALIAMVLVYYFRSTGGRKVAIVACAVAVAVLAVFALPESALERLSTVIDAFRGPSTSRFSEDMTEAEASAAERHEIAGDAIVTTLEHPFVGIGAGMFAQYRWDVMLRPDGTHKPYLPAHNTYLEIAAGCGIPGVVLYVMFLWSMYASIRTTRKLSAARATPQADLIWSIALCAEAALVYFSVCAMFMTCDKHPHQFALAGFTIAMLRMARALPVEVPVAASLMRSPIAPARFAVKRPWPVEAR